MTNIKAEVICDSVSIHGNRLTTFELTFPRIILAEFNTHRAFSRNSASSRAIPFAKMIESIDEDAFVPIAWIKKHKGMQGFEYFEEVADIKVCTDLWFAGRDAAMKYARILDSMGVTKQFTNRMLEPYMWHKVIMTSSKEGLDNFFKLRAHKDAEIHIQDLAYTMQNVLAASTPEPLNEGEWHIPYVEDIPTLSLEDKLKVATARCARVSYTTVGQNESSEYTDDIRLYNRLLQSGHMSPFEHCAQVMDAERLFDIPMSRNFRGFIQYREIIEKKV